MTTTEAPAKKKDSDVELATRISVAQEAASMAHMSDFFDHLKNIPVIGQFFSAMFQIKTGQTMEEFDLKADSMNLAVDEMNNLAQNLADAQKNGNLNDAEVGSLVAKAADNLNLTDLEKTDLVMRVDELLEGKDLASVDFPALADELADLTAEYAKELIETTPAVPKSDMAIYGEQIAFKEEYLSSEHQEFTLYAFADDGYLGEIKTGAERGDILNAVREGATLCRVEGREGDTGAFSITYPNGKELLVEYEALNLDAIHQDTEAHAQFLKTPKPELLNSKELEPAQKPDVNQNLQGVEADSAGAFQMGQPPPV